ncbi:aspartyl protease family protein [Caulobacter sp. CCUG 60055]|uniref:aspartyl protease family protein n=1 Tax=Caulobacter sp. CCUG 60055 TaxID=2100090 RepID=UPI001FA7109E
MNATIRWRSTAILAAAGLGFAPPVWADPAPATRAEAVEAPFTLAAEHIYVDVEINGQGPFHFILDTGAVNVLTPETASRLNLALERKVEAVGTGGTQSARETKVQTVRIGGATLRDQPFYVIDLPPAVVASRPVDGLIGHGWLSRTPTRIDYAASKLTFYPSQGWRYGGAAPATPLHFKGALPQVDAAVDGVSGRFTLDTGSSGSLILYPAFVDKNDLIARYRPKTEIMSAVGVGGPVFSLITRAKRLDVAGVSVDGPVTFLSRAKSGAAADARTAGSFGFGVLRRFTVTLDYAKGQAFFEPNAALGEPDLADRSGLRLETAPEGFKVTFVAVDSPGMRAGLRAGDIIRAVEGAPAAGLDLSAMRTRLKGAVGAKIALEVAGRTAPVVVELGDL